MIDEARAEQWQLFYARRAVEDFSAGQNLNGLHSRLLMLMCHAARMSANEGPAHALVMTCNSHDLSQPYRQNSTHKRSP